jgi:hypothetical protein
MPFFEQLRRRSKASFRTARSQSHESKSNGSQSNGEVPSGQSSSTLETASYSSVTPPSSIKPTVSSSNLPSLSESNGSSSNGNGSLAPQRPALVTSPVQRNSMVVRIYLLPKPSSPDHSPADTAFRRVGAPCPVIAACDPQHLPRHMLPASCPSRTMLG